MDEDGRNHDNSLDDINFQKPILMICFEELLKVILKNLCFILIKYFNMRI